jgi:hypothetical protein
MTDDAQATLARTSDDVQATLARASDGADLEKRAVASITIQPQDLRPFVLRRWTATAQAGIWSLDDPLFDSFYWRARSKEKLVNKAIEKLQREALSRGVDRPIIIVTDSSSHLKFWIAAA